MLASAYDLFSRRGVRDVGIDADRARREPAAWSIDVALRALSKSANKGRLWLSLAAVGSTLRGRSRRGALRGAGSLAVTSLIVNAVVKPVIRRNRPDIEGTPLVRRLSRPPRTTSFPSGHAASAAAFATGVFLEHRIAGLALAPLAATVGYSRVHVGVHHVSDVLAGAGLGVGVALAAQWWWPVLRLDQPPAAARRAAPALPGGAGLVVVLNPEAGVGDDDDGGRIAERLPKAEIIRLTGDLDLDAELDRRAGSIQALGVAGGDGTVAAVAAAAVARRLPLAVFPTGTLNHFARDVGIESADDTARAVEAGRAVSVELATVGGVPFVNTASIGSYPEMVRRRDELTGRVGKWLAMAIAAADVLHRQQPLRLTINESPTDVWTLFVGNGRYIRHGPFPTRRERLDDGLLDVHYLKVATLSRTWAVLSAVAGVSRHSGAYRSLLTSSLRVESRSGAVEIARDGEPGERETTFHFRKLPTRLLIYRPGL